MPTYDYVCAGCGHAFEAFQEMSAKKLRTCPKCRKPRLERQVGAGAGLIFKGSGFYITDYRKGGEPGSKPAEGSGAGSTTAPAAGTGSTGSSGSSAGASAPAAAPAPAAPAAPAGPRAPATPARGSAGGSKGGSKGGGRKG
ncbi:MAG: FmdB family zinc ribbon protein [Planctomycetia bacterium]